MSKFGVMQFYLSKIKIGAWLAGLVLSLVVVGCAERKPSFRYAPAPGDTTPYIFCSGNFKSPGRYVWTNGMTLQDGIDAAGGLNEYARQRIFLVRGHGREMIRLISGRTATNNPALNPSDRISSPYHCPW